MSKIRIFLTFAFVLVLGMSVWTIAAVSFTGVSTNFSSGDIVSASDFNNLFGAIDQNFQDAETQINTNESDIATNASDISSLQSNKVSVSGDSMSGRLQVQGDTGAASSPPDGTSAALFVENTNSSGVSAFIRGQGGSQAPLYVKNLGGGPLFTATNGSEGLQVENDGSLRVGSTGSPQITLDVASGDITLATGTVRNAAGDSLLPAAYASISAGSISQATSNVSAVRNPNTGVYEVDFTGITFSTDFTVDPVVTSSSLNNGPGVESVTHNVLDSDTLEFNIADSSGAATNSDFSFVVHLP